MREQTTGRHFEITHSICGNAIVATGLIALVGWITGVHVLTQISPRFIPMAPDTALAFVILGILLLTYHQRTARRLPGVLMFALAGMIGIYGLLKALEYPLGMNLTFASFLFPVKEFLGHHVVGRMSPVTGALFFLSGAAIFILLVEKYRHRLRMLIGGTGVIVSGAGYLTTYAYLVGAPFLYHGDMIPLAAPTAVAFCFLGIGLIVAAGPEGILKPFVGSNTRSRTLRLFVPLVVLTCFAQEFLHHLLLRADVHGALLVLIVPLGAALIAAITGERLARYLSSRLHVAEHLLEESEEKFRGLFYNAQVGMFRSRMDGSEILEANDKALEIFGRTQDEKQNTSAGIHWADPREREEMVRRLKANGSVSDFECRLVSQHGDVRNFLWSVRLDPEQETMQGSVLDITDRKRAEEERQQSLSLLEATLESTADGILVVAATGKVTACNHRFLELWRIPEDLAKREDDEKLLAHVLGQLIDSEGFLAKVRDLYAHPREESYDVLEFNDGRTFERFSKPHIIKDQVVGRVWSFRDITAHREAEKALRENAERLRLLFDNLTVGVYRTTPDGRVLIANPALVRMLGYSSFDELAQHDLEQSEFAPSHPRSVFRMRLEKEGEISGFESAWKRPDGSVVFLRENAHAIRGEDGTILYYEGAAEDVTMHRQAKVALRRSERLLRDSQSVAHLGSYELDISAGTWTSSPELDDLFGIDTQFARTVDRWLSIVHPEWRETMAQYFATEVLGKGERFDKEYKIVRQTDGQECWVHGLGDLTFDDQGRPIRMIGTIQNISDRKQAEAERAKLEAQLRQAQKLETIGTLAGGVAHDFNNILTPIMVYAEMAAKRVNGDQPTHSDLEHVIAGANRAKDLVKQILTFSRQTERELIVIELSSIVKEALKLLQATFPSTIAIEANIQTGCGEVLADPSQIHQVLMNLCTNAFHAMREKGGELTVNLESVTVTEETARTIPALTAGEFVRLTVSDTGCGMDEKTQGRIFEPFFTTKKVGEGTGLGLSVVHGIVTSLDGAITVQSEVGQGTVFEVYLPRIRATHRARIVEEAAVVGGHEQILVVDDEPEVANVLKEVLEELFGYTVTVRTSSVDALELLRSRPNRFDAVITDLTMPHLTGDHLAREIQAFRKDLPIILMTGFSEMMDEERCRQLGIAGFLLKPPLSADLARMVRKVLDGVPA